MNNVTTAEANRLLDLSLPLGGQAWLGLTSTVPTPDVGGIEFTPITAPGYARAPVPLGAAAAGEKSNSDYVYFPIAGQPWPVVLGYELWDAAQGGFRRWWRVLTLAEQRAVVAGDQFKIPSGSLQFSLS